MLCSDANAPRIATRIGEVLEIEDPAIARGFLRVRVIMNTLNPLPISCWILRDDNEQTWIEFRYESWRYRCSRISRSNTECNFELTTRARVRRSSAQATMRRNTEQCMDNVEMEQSRGNGQPLILENRGRQQSQRRWCRLSRWSDVTLFGQEGIFQPSHQMMLEFGSTSSPSIHTLVILSDIARNISTLTVKNPTKSNPIMMEHEACQEEENSYKMGGRARGPGYWLALILAKEESSSWCSRKCSGKKTASCKQIKKNECSREMFDGWTCDLCRGRVEWASS